MLVGQTRKGSAPLRRQFETWLRQNGFVGDGTTDDSAALQAALNAAAAYGRGMWELPEGIQEIRCDAQLTWDLGKVGLDGKGARINFRYKTAAGPCVTFVSTASDNDFKRNLTTMRNLTLMRNDGVGSSMRDDSTDNAVASAAATATSTTSLTVGTGSKSLTVQTGKSYAAGMTVRIAQTSNSANKMEGIVTAYTSGTGALVVYVSSIGGSGTISDWTVSQTGIDGMLFDSTSGGHAARGRFENVVLEGFRDAIYIGRNAYLLSFVGGTITRNRTALASRNKTAGIFSNQGEHISFEGTLFGNNYEIFEIEGIFCHFYGKSADYPSNKSSLQRLGRIHSDGRVFWNSMHCEFRDNQDASQETLLEIGGSNSSFVWNNGMMVCMPYKSDGTTLIDVLSGDGFVASPTSGNYRAYTNLDHFIKVVGKGSLGGNGVGQIVIRDVEFTGTAAFKSRQLVKIDAAITDPPDIIDFRGSNLSWVDGGTFSAMGKSIAPALGDGAANAASRVLSCSLDPDFSDTTTVRDGWYLCGSGGAYVSGQESRLSNSNGAISISGNTMRVTKTTGAGTAHRLRVLIPVEYWKTFGLMFELGKTGGAAGNTITSTVQFAQLFPGGSNKRTSGSGVPYNDSPLPYTTGTAGSATARIGASTTLLTFADNGAVTPVPYNLHSWSADTVYDKGARVAQPRKGNHVLIEFNMDSVDGTAGFELQVKKWSPGWL